MNFVPFDQTPGLTPAEVALLRELRYSDPGRLFLRLLTEFPPPRTVVGPDTQPHNDSYLLGRREAYDDVVRAFSTIGKIEDRPVAAPVRPTYPVQKRTNLAKPAVTQE